MKDEIPMAGESDTKGYRFQGLTADDNSSIHRHRQCEERGAEAFYHILVETMP